MCRRLQRIIIQGGTAPHLPLIVSRSHHVVGETATPSARSCRDQLAEVREQRQGMLSLFMRAS